MPVHPAVVFGAIGCLSVAGAVGGSRWRRIERRRAELNIAYEKVMEEMRALDDDRLHRVESLREKEKKTRAMHETVDSLWTDRLQRYALTNLDLHAYLHALPEALGALKGVTNHYRYMSEEMQKFVGFDIACCKLHNLSLLLQHGRTVGLTRTAGTIQEMFVAEPLVTSVVHSVMQTDGISCPTTIAEASATFTFCMEDLEAAIAHVTKRYADSLVVPAEPSLNVVSDGVRELVKKSQLDLLSSGQRELVKKRASLDAILVREQRQLHTLEDIRVALSYVEKVRSHFTQAPKRGLFRKEDKFLVAVQSDDSVRQSLQQIEIWQNATATFLLQQQAQDALDCYQLLLAETLTKVTGE